MLVLSRKVGEKIVIGDNITITINRIAGNRVTVGVDAPGDVHILRGELQRTLALPSGAEEAVEWELAGTTG